MTSEDVRANVTDEMRLATSALQAAQALLDLGLAPDAASRIYYAAFHAARALLFSSGIDARTHRGVQTLLSRHFVMTKILAAEHAKDLAQLEAIRSSGDYDTTFALGPAELHPELAKARRFVDAVTALLRSSGWSA